MERTWRPTVAGILGIIAGVIAVITGLRVLAVVGTATGGVLGLILDLLGLGGVITGIEAVLVVLVVLGIVALVGGIYALKRRVWGLALAGSICALVGPWFILGILAIIFVSLGKGEFE